uniref:Uncharacterized protein n=1 Tax=Chromera velia CCMP2878 TaxID=1169474 RepID=A0A0G4IE03_9ALVE|eukprot:Cvel_13592.t1-p1 / transcript=Cvel_13592.t1 / gene=Cvel_13592 / organism=Chromera_velia_CCMP2878 / gene_product=hypothetical protein / transcript_product=hypothetical protein / location=Cvel_scaffold935:19349-27118(+) / protein_length=1009 / sequence_SO=supercontig / SO=protein_coding / is_pseudo=false
MALGDNAQLNAGRLVGAPSSILSRERLEQETGVSTGEGGGDSGMQTVPDASPCTAPQEGDLQCPLADASIGSPLTAVPKSLFHSFGPSSELHEFGLPPLRPFEFDAPRGSAAEEEEPPTASLSSVFLPPGHPHSQYHPSDGIFPSEAGNMERDEVQVAETGCWGVLASMAAESRSHRPSVADSSEGTSLDSDGDSSSSLSSRRMRGGEGLRGGGVKGVSRREREWERERERGGHCSSSAFASLKGRNRRQTRLDSPTKKNERERFDEDGDESRCSPLSLARTTAPSSSADSGGAGARRDRERDYPATGPSSRQRRAGSRGPLRLDGHRRRRRGGKNGNSEQTQVRSEKAVTERDEAPLTTAAREESSSSIQARRRIVMPMKRSTFYSLAAIAAVGALFAYWRWSRDWRRRRGKRGLGRGGTFGWSSGMMRAMGGVAIVVLWRLLQWRRGAAVRLAEVLETSEIDWRQQFAIVWHSSLPVEMSAHMNMPPQGPSGGRGGGRGVRGNARPAERFATPPASSGFMPGSASSFSSSSSSPIVQNGNTRKELERTLRKGSSIVVQPPVRPSPPAGFFQPPGNGPCSSLPRSSSSTSDSIVAMWPSAGGGRGKGEAWGSGAPRIFIPHEWEALKAAARSGVPLVPCLVFMPSSSAVENQNSRGSTWSLQNLASRVLGESPLLPVLGAVVRGEDRRKPRVCVGRPVHPSASLKVFGWGSSPSMEDADEVRVDEGGLESLFFSSSSSSAGLPAHERRKDEGRGRTVEDAEAEREFLERYLISLQEVWDRWAAGSLAPEEASRGLSVLIGLPPPSRHCLSVSVDALNRSVTYRHPDGEVRVSRCRSDIGCGCPSFSPVRGGVRGTREVFASSSSPSGDAMSSPSRHRIREGEGETQAEKRMDPPPSFESLNREAVSLVRSTSGVSSGVCSSSCPSQSDEDLSIDRRSEGVAKSRPATAPASPGGSAGCVRQGGGEDPFQLCALREKGDPLPDRGRGEEDWICSAADISVGGRGSLSRL